MRILNILQDPGCALRCLQPCLSIRQKLLLGAGLMIALILAISLYAILQLRQLHTLITTALTVDTGILRESENLKSLLLTQLGNERKFIITGDEDFRQLFDDNARDFKQTLAELAPLGKDDALRSLLARLESAYDAYCGLAVAGFAKDGRQQPQNSRPAGAAVDEILEQLYAAAQQQLSRKMLSSQEISSGGMKAALLIALLSSIGALISALLLARSIYQPLGKLKEATRYIAQGDFTREIDILRQDEIGELAEAFNIMRQRLQELDRMKSDFIANITHDLKTPLASITEANQLVLDGAAGAVTAPQQRLAGIISQDAARLMKLISSIIDLAKMESGMLAYDLRQADMGLLAREAVESVRFLAAAKNIQLVYEPAGSLPRLLADDDMLRQALINLLTNAIKFTSPAGAVTVRLQPAPMHAGSDGGACAPGIAVSVSDTGRGIPEEDLPRVFDKFYRGRTAPAAEGSGLGLAIARHIVQAHGGRIWAESTAGAGSTLHVLLPAAAPPPTHAEARES